MHPTDAAADCIRRFRCGTHPVGSTASANYGLRISKAYYLEPDDFEEELDLR